MADISGEKRKKKAVPRAVGDGVNLPHQKMALKVKFHAL